MILYCNCISFKLCEQIFYTKEVDKMRPNHRTPGFFGIWGPQKFWGGFDQIRSVQLFQQFNNNYYILLPHVLYRPCRKVFSVSNLLCREYYNMVRCFGHIINIYNYNEKRSLKIKTPCNGIRNSISSSRYVVVGL